MVTLATIAGLVALHLARLGLERVDPSAGETLLEATVLGHGALEPWRFVTYALLHGDLWHLVGNCVFLWVFGPNVEDRFGRVWYALFLVVGAVASGLGHIATTAAPVIGASGAVSAATGAYFVLFPRTRIKTFILFIFITSAMIPAWVFIGIAVARDLLSEAFFGASSGVAHVAHLAGYALGAGVSAVALKLKLLTPEVYDLMYTLKQGSRRAAMRSAVSAASRRGPVARESAAARDPEHERATAARSEVSRLIAEGRLDAAADRVRAEAAGLDALAARALLPGRDATLRLAEHCVGTQRRADAAWLYERFVDTYPEDREAPSARLMAALLLVRDLEEPERGRALLAGRADRYAGSERELAEELLAETSGHEAAGKGTA